MSSIRHGSLVDVVIQAHGRLPQQVAELQVIRLLESWGLDVILATPFQFIATDPEHTVEGPDSAGLLVEACLYPLPDGVIQIRWQFRPRPGHSTVAGSKAVELALLLLRCWEHDSAWVIDAMSDGLL
jgi:hypothetical protein